MKTLKVAEKITVNQFRGMYFEEADASYYELMEGELIRRSAPAVMHQRILKELLIAINAYLCSNKIGEIFFAPLDVMLDNYNQLQPDLFFVANEHGSIITTEGIKGVPDMVVEILSPSSVMRDRIDKKRIYQRSGVKEYWLVSPEYAEIEVFVLQDDQYEIFSAATSQEGELKSFILKELQLDLKQIFGGSS
jgi:Uma2 family endonuclease